MLRVRYPQLNLQQRKVMGMKVSGRPLRRRLTSCLQCPSPIPPLLVRTLSGVLLRSLSVTGTQFRLQPSFELRFYA